MISRLIKNQKIRVSHQKSYKEKPFSFTTTQRRQWRHKNFSLKTKFIQETLEDPRFNDGERTLVLIFEEGEEFLSEETMFHYHYSLDTLMYCYQLYFTYEHDGGKIINNDWGHECIVK